MLLGTGKRESISIDYIWVKNNGNEEDTILIFSFNNIYSIFYVLFRIWLLSIYVI